MAQLSFLWPSIFSQQVPQWNTGAKGSVVWVHACFIVFPACHIHNGMKDILLVETDEGRNLSSWSAVSWVLFHCKMNKWLIFVSFYHNNNNRNTAFVVMLLFEPWSAATSSHNHREMLSLTVFIMCVLGFCLYHKDLGLCKLEDSITQRQTWAEIQDHRLNWHFLRLHIYK